MKKEASLSIIENTSNNKLLMIRHHRGINKGCINFPGGKKENNETMLDCVIRETYEETGLTIKNPVQVGYIEFPTMDYYVHIFKSTEFSGNLKGKEDEVDVFWLDINAIPYDEMREADRNFIPDILAEKYVKRRYNYDESFHIQSIEEI